MNRIVWWERLNAHMAVWNRASQVGLAVGGRRLVGCHWNSAGAWLPFCEVSDQLLSYFMKCMACRPFSRGTIRLVIPEKVQVMTFVMLSFWNVPVASMFPWHVKAFERYTQNELSHCWYDVITQKVYSRFIMTYLFKGWIQAHHFMRRLTGNLL